MATLTSVTTTDTSTAHPGRGRGAELNASSAPSIAPNDLEVSSKSWARLIPLATPSICASFSPSGACILINKKFAASKHSDRVHIAVVSPAATLSSHVLSSRSLSAACIQDEDSPPATAADFEYALRAHGFSMGNGLVIVRPGEHFHVQLLGAGEVLDVTVEDLIDVDHCVNIILDLSLEARRSTCTIRRLLYDFSEMSKVIRLEIAAATAAGEPMLLIDGRKHPLVTARQAIRTCLRDFTKLFSLKRTTLSLHCANVNGLSTLEQNILVHELFVFARENGIGAHITTSSLSDPSSRNRAFAISLCPLPASALPATPLVPTPPPSPPPPQHAVPESIAPSKHSFAADRVRRRIAAACENVIRAEPEITRLDTLAGDGDCGHTLAAGAQAVLQLLPSLDLAHLPRALMRMIDVLEESTGGTTGAVYCIFLSAFAQELGVCERLDEALERALDTLLGYTKARQGDRTLVDVLVPFVETLPNGVREALEAAREGAEETKTMEALVGRASYLEKGYLDERGLADAGAVGLMCVLEGLCGDA